MLVEYISGRVIPNKHQRPHVVSAQHYKELVAYITGSFQQPNGAFILAAGVGYASRYNLHEAKANFTP
ncbi:hypothetical protein [Pontibacter chitinilyticus]|uniref:hypothetical protein n=1 Tax=Pontibacter chitinilyticus TaxID=2674989 RepID=UPI00321BBA3E